jgi:NitT/TauT family transport system ATP-binding protein
MVELERVSIAYRVPGGTLLAVEGASAVFPEGLLTALVGPSGCGKTSLLQAIAGLVPLTSGELRVAGRPVEGVRERSALIFQDAGLLPWKTVRDNAELPLVIRHIGRRERRARVDPILDELGLLPFESFHPARLSGGMRQRLGVARALAQDADLLLMDEPFSSLDALTRESLQEGLEEVRRRHTVTVVLVTHSIEEAAYLADLVYVMAGHAPGRVAALVDWRIDTARRAGPRGADFRASPAYFERCAQLRRAFETASKSIGGGA